MKRGFYRKLASGGIYKNRQTYLPYLLTCIGMVMMYYIISFLTVSGSIAAMRGGEEMQMVLGMGSGVIAVFSVIFLFYTNSFLIRRRKKEFGLYNILGMGKRNLFRVLLWENVIVACIALGGGLVCGILFSKLAELCMAKVLATESSLIFTIEWQAVIKTLVLFAVIFGLILANAVRQIHLAKPVELMSSEAVGEKPPKAKWLTALLGAALLGGAYYLAVSIEDPLSAMLWFFVAVVMVILATYLLFVAGSVALCRLLQKNKKYYYKTSHFVSVSSMVYRMKRNGAGLASICILSTMVLVMVSSTACLFLGIESNIRNRYPRHVVTDIYSMEDAYAAPVLEKIGEVVKNHGLLQENVLHYRYLAVGGYNIEDQIIFDQSRLESFNMSGFSNIRQLFIVPVEDYNRIMGVQKTLNEDEVILYATKAGYDYDTITIEGFGTVKIKERVTDFVRNGIDTMQVMPSMFLFVSDIEQVQKLLEIQAEIYGDNGSLGHTYYGIDLACEDDEMIQIQQEISNRLTELMGADPQYPLVRTECAAEQRSGFQALYGGMFLLGILLGLVFILAAVLIIYYKQISEGYEDQSRFLIMRKVGMTKKEIRKSINSQILTVFFLPLLAAGIHTAFAFPMIYKMLVIFGLTDMVLFIKVVVGCYLLFTLFYILVYRITSRAYYSIVSSSQ